MNREQEKKEIREHWFKDHKATVEVQGDQTIIKWKKEGTNIYAVYYIIRLNRLFVFGDIGDAIYCWSGEINLDFLSDLSLDYFASKCQASEYGRGYEEWNGDSCFESAKYWLEDIKADEAEEVEVDFESWAEKYLEERDTSLAEIRNSCESKEEWFNWLESYGYEVFDSDYFELGHSGFEPSMRCLGHLIGLKMVSEQIKKESEKEISNDKAANL